MWFYLILSVDDHFSRSALSASIEFVIIKTITEMVVQLKLITARCFLTLSKRTNDSSVCVVDV